MLLLERPAGEVLNTPLTLEEDLALPEDSRCEVVDGLLRPTTRSGKRNRTGGFREVGVFRRGDRITEAALPWVDIDVTSLLGRFA